MVVTDPTGLVARVKLGALITRLDDVPPQVVITDVDLERPTRYTVTQSGGEIIHEVVATREEIHHLHDHLNARVPKHEIDLINDPQKYLHVGYEQDALYYRFRLLSQLDPDRWAQYHRLVGTGVLRGRIASID